VTADLKPIKHLSGPAALAIGDAIDNTVNPNKLCLSGFSYPVAIALGKIISSGGSGGAVDIAALHRMGFSASDSAAIVSAAQTRGSH
jgi:hypothetical protein